MVIFDPCMCKVETGSKTAHSLRHRLLRRVRRKKPRVQSEARGLPSGGRLTRPLLSIRHDLV